VHLLGMYMKLKPIPSRLWSSYPQCCAGVMTALQPAAVGFLHDIGDLSVIVEVLIIVWSPSSFSFTLR
jgi:hypothetical protein